MQMVNFTTQVAEQGNKIKAIKIQLLMLEDIIFNSHLFQGKENLHKKVSTIKDKHLYNFVDRASGE